MDDELKKPSGAQFRKMRADKTLQQGKISKDDLEAYRKIGPPPLDSMGRIKWASDMAALTLWLAVVDPKVPNYDRRRYVEAYTKALGMTHAKASVEEKLLGFQKQLGLSEGTDNGDGLEDLDSVEDDPRNRRGSKRRDSLQRLVSSVSSEDDGTEDL